LDTSCLHFGLGFPFLASITLEESLYHPPGNLNHIRILHCRRHLNLSLELAIDCVFYKLSQDSAERFAATCLWNQTFTLNHAAQARNSTNLLADTMLYLNKELVRRQVGVGTKRDKCKRQVAFEVVGYTNDARLSDSRV
jgi:hypothetical protein